MFAPGAAQLADDFYITSSTIVTFTVSIYILGYVVGPPFLSPIRLHLRHGRLRSEHKYSHVSRLSIRLWLCRICTAGHYGRHDCGSVCTEPARHSHGTGMHRSAARSSSGSCHWWFCRPRFGMAMDGLAHIDAGKHTFPLVARHVSS